LQLQGIKIKTLELLQWNMWWWWWWCYSTPSDGWGRRGTPRTPNSWATPQGLNQRSKMEEVVPKTQQSGHA